MKFKMSWSVLGIILVSFTYQIDSAKILCFFPTTSKSQLIIGQHLMLGLVDAGHEVTVVSQFPLGREVTNYRDVVITPKTNVAGKFLLKSL